MTRFSALALLLLVAAPPAHPQSAPDPAVQLDQYIQQVMADWGTVGLAVAVVKDGRVVFSKGYGVRTKGTTNPVDANTLFAIGSTTKAMTLAAPFPPFSLALLTNPLDNEEPRPERTRCGASLSVHGPGAIRAAGERAREANAAPRATSCSGALTPGRTDTQRTPPLVARRRGQLVEVPSGARNRDSATIITFFVWCGFRTGSDTGFGRIRTPVSLGFGHRFRSHSDTRFGPLRTRDRDGVRLRGWVLDN